MSGSVNLSPGSIVPKTGTYKCEFCGAGGIADLMGKALGGSGLGLNTIQLSAIGRQSTIKHFEAGKTFPQCPTCGPATGWTLIEEPQTKEEEPAASHDESISESGVCDICTQKVFRPNGYALTTQQVVSTPAYWQQYYQYHKSELEVMGVTSFNQFCQNPILRDGCIKMIASQTTPWMVCERCISMFAVDRNQTQSYARQWWESGRKYSPPGTGPTSLNSVKMT